MVAALVVLLLAASTITARHDEPQEEPPAAGYTESGSYLVGSPVAHIFIDACMTNATNDVDSSCRSIPASVRGSKPVLTYTAALSPLTSPTVCFYGTTGGATCGALFVPQNAVKMSVSSTGGVAVSWSVTFK